MKSAVLAIVFGLVMFAAFCKGTEWRSGGGCYHGSCWKYCGNDLQPWENGYVGTYYAIQSQFPKFLFSATLKI